jgi:hypothetical protein
VLKVDRMTLSPAQCLSCGSGNVPDEHGDVGPFIDLQVEVGWGDSVYLCPLCVHKIATLFGYMSPNDVADLEARRKKAVRQAHDLKAQLEEKNRRLSVIRDARKAIKAEREEVVS